MRSAPVPSMLVNVPLHDSVFAKRISREWDLVVLAHIREQFALSLGSYGRPRMTEELKEQGLQVGHRRVGRIMRENNICVERSKKYKVRRDQKLIQWINFPDARLTEIIPSTSPRTYWMETSPQPRRTKNGPAISVTSGPAKGGSTWLCSLISIPGGSLVGRCQIG